MVERFGAVPRSLVASHRVSGALFAVTGLGAFLSSMDVSLANGLLPRIGASLHTTDSVALAWVLTAYVIVFAATLVPAGRLADLAGRRRAYMTGLAVLALGSALCAVAEGLPVMIVGRVVQAVGAACAAPASLGLLIAGAPLEKRSLWTSRWAGVGALGIGAGPIVGGLVTTVSSWRLAFLVNVVLIVVALSVVRSVVAETESSGVRGLPDPLGSLMMGAAAALVTLSLSEIGGWGPLDVRTLLSLAAGCILAVAFVWRSGRVTDPTVDLSLLRRRTIAATTASTFFYSCAFFGLIYSYVAFLGTVWHLSLLHAGLAMLPVPGAVMVLTTNVGGVSGRFGFRLPITTGVLVMGAGLGLTCLLAGHPGFTVWWLTALAVVGIGSGLSFPLLSAASVDGLPANRLASASAVNQCARQIGAALGVASTVSVLTAVSAADAPDAFRIAWLVSMGFCVLAAASAFAIGPCAGRGAQSSRGAAGAAALDPLQNERSVRSAS